MEAMAGVRWGAGCSRCCGSLGRRITVGDRNRRYLMGNRSSVCWTWRNAASAGGVWSGGWRCETLRRRKFEIRVKSAPDSDSIVLQNAVQQVEKMRASAIKLELSNLGISYADCFEKQELVMRLATARVSNYRSAKAVSGNSKSFKTLAHLPITRLKSTANSPKNYILVPLKINNQGPFNFILDTGSTVTLINPSIVYEKLKLTPQPVQQSMALLGGGLSNQRNMSVSFRDVKVGDHSMSNISALLMDQTMLQGWDPSAAGLLGLNILSQFDVEFDFVKENLAFYPPGAASRGECDMNMMEKVLTSEITLGILGVKVALGLASPELALLDLGSSLCVASPDIAGLAGVSETILRGKSPALGGGGIGSMASMQFKSGYIDVNIIASESERANEQGKNLKVEGVQFAIGEIPALRSVGCRILLGVNVFKDIKMIFSQSTKSVYMQRA